MAVAILFCNNAIASDQRSEVNKAYQAAWAIGETQKTCRDAIGLHLAEVLVEWCGTHSAESAYCDERFPCLRIIDAIRRNCQSAPIPCYDPY